MAFRVHALCRLVAMCVVCARLDYAIAATRRVPDDYPSIVAAVGASAPGDTVDIGPGSYYENVNVSIPLMILGRAGATGTTVDGQQHSHALSVVGGSTVEGLTLTHGEAAYGGGLYVSGNGMTAIRNCTITANHAEYGGGLAVDNRAVVTVTDCVFTDNAAGGTDHGDGGGIYCSPTAGSTMVTQTRLTANLAGDSGGGIYQDLMRNFFTVTNCVVENNLSHVAGGGLFLTVAECSGTLVNGNHCDSYAGGIYANSSFVHHNTIVNNTIFNNLPDAPSGLYVAGCATHHNLIAINHGIPGGAGVVIRQGSLYCNDAWGNGGSQYFAADAFDSTQGGNISADPQFCGPDVFTLSVASPCAQSPCGRIGAFDAACGETSVRRESWGSLKQRFR